MFQSMSVPSYGRCISNSRPKFIVSLLGMRFRRCAQPLARLTRLPRGHHTGQSYNIHTTAAWPSVLGSEPAVRTPVAGSITINFAEPPKARPVFSETAWPLALSSSTSPGSIPPSSSTTNGLSTSCGSVLGNDAHLEPHRLLRAHSVIEDICNDLGVPRDLPVAARCAPTR